jgi:hypothetical protein
MAGYYRYTAVLDACVLYPAPLRDLLMSLAVEGMYGARWTTQVHDEWVRNLIAKRPDLDKQKLLRTAALMNEVVEDALGSARSRRQACAGGRNRWPRRRDRDLQPEGFS